MRRAAVCALPPGQWQRTGFNCSHGLSENVGDRKPRRMADVAAGDLIGAHLAGLFREGAPDHDGPHRRLDRKKPRADHRLASQVSLIARITQRRSAAHTPSRRTDMSNSCARRDMSTADDRPAPGRGTSWWPRGQRCGGGSSTDRRTFSVDVTARTGLTGAGNES